MSKSRAGHPSRKQQDTYTEKPEESRILDPMLMFNAHAIFVNSRSATMH